ncbi:hypothetical protein PG985_012856 [Apiospora marii]|uniref:uncharacterized protein n=1 Tax=Apiospora marii TaxID=335849 RepID=UPI0031322CF6
MRFQTPLLVIASLLSVASAWPSPDSHNLAREVSVSTVTDHDYGQNKRNKPAAREVGFEPVGKGGEPVSRPNPMPPPAHADQGAGKNTEDGERPHGGGHSHETHTAAGPPHPAPTM